jgi:hypothetical protein
MCESDVALKVTGVGAVRFNIAAPLWDHPQADTQVAQQWRMGCDLGRRRPARNALLIATEPQKVVGTVTCLPSILATASWTKACNVPASGE